MKLGPRSWSGSSAREADGARASATATAIAAKNRLNSGFMTPLRGLPARPEAYVAEGRESTGGVSQTRDRSGVAPSAPICAGVCYNLGRREIHARDRLRG